LDDGYVYLQERQTVMYSLWYSTPTVWLAGGLDAEHSLTLLKMDITVAWNMLS